MMTFRCLFIGQSLLLIHHRHFWSQISTIGPYHCIRNDLIKSHFRRLRFDQNNSSLMNGTDSISDPVARRLRCTESYPSARSSAQLNLARLNSAQLGSRLVTWQVGPIMLTCQLTWHAHYACWRHAYDMMTSLSSGSGTWVGSSGIRVGSAHLGEEDTYDAWHTSVRVGSHLASACGCFRRQISTRFSTVASSLPPLHGGMVKTQF